MSPRFERIKFKCFVYVWLLVLLRKTCGATVVIGSSVVSHLPTASPPAGPALPDFSEPIRNVTVPMGREAVLSCVISNLAEYKVGWLRADDQTILSLQKRTVTHNPRISVSHDESRTWNLHIRQVKESDQGCYMCQINTAVMKKQLGCVTVQVPPDIVDEKSTSDVTVNEGDNVTLTCAATGKPAPRILWRREDGQKILVPHHKASRTAAVTQRQQRHDGEPARDPALADHRPAAVVGTGNRERFREVESYQGETLRLYHVTRHMMAAYMCIASNDVPPAVSKRVPLNVNFGPLVAASMNVVGAPVGSDVRLACSVESHPPSITYWVRGEHGGHERGTILPNAMNTNKYSIDEQRSNGVAAPAYSTTMTLVIRDFQPQDRSAYVCVATNSLGTAEASVQIYEVARPTTSTAYRASSPSSTRSSHASGSADVSRSGKTAAGHLSDAAPDDDGGKRYSRYHDWSSSPSSSSSPAKDRERDAGRASKSEDRDSPGSSSTSTSLSHHRQLLLVLATLASASSARHVQLLRH